MFCSLFYTWPCVDYFVRLSYCYFIGFPCPLVQREKDGCVGLEPISLALPWICTSMHLAKRSQWLSVNVALGMRAKGCMEWGVMGLVSHGSGGPSLSFPALRCVYSHGSLGHQLKLCFLAIGQSLVNKLCHKKGCSSHLMWLGPLLLYPVRGC